jgi:fatty acid desaturase
MTVTSTASTPAPKTIQKTVAGKTITMTPEQAEAFGRELDGLKERVIADLGERDATYIHRIIKAQRALEVGGRTLLFGGIFPPFWLAGTAMLGLSKIIDNMEIGHNVMHGQYDWMGDPAISSRGFEWDTACPGDQWQALKDYVAFPLLAGPFAPWVFAGNLSANLIRNIWSFMIIFCGHFPEDVQEFSIEETKAETRGMWYFRQVLGSANLTGGKLFHILSGNLSFQIEHHLFPDIPAHRHAEISEEVREICRRYGVPYNTGPLPRQFATVVRKIVKLALPRNS